MDTAIHKRRTTLMRIEAGYYVFLTEDRDTVWAVRRVYEDGSAHIVESGKPIIGTFWEALRVKLPESLVERDKDGRIVSLPGRTHPTWWDEPGSLWSDMHPTRREAVDSVLEAAP